MATRLPNPGGDDGDWGDILNAFLSVEHNPDGTLKKAGEIASALQSVIAGTNVTVDNTDPVHPVINSTGSAFPDFSGDGPPEGVQTADVGQSYVDTTNGGLFFKGHVSDDPTTGWLGAIADAAGNMFLLGGPAQQTLLTDSGWFQGQGNGLAWVANGTDGEQRIDLQLGSAGQYRTRFNADGSTVLPGPLTLGGQYASNLIIPNGKELFITDEAGLEGNGGGIQINSTGVDHEQSVVIFLGPPDGPGAGQWRFMPDATTIFPGSLQLDGGNGKFVVPPNVPDPSKGYSGGFGIDTTSSLDVTLNGAVLVPCDEAATLGPDANSTVDYDDEWMTWESANPSQFTVKKAGWYLLTVDLQNQGVADLPAGVQFNVEANPQIVPTYSRFADHVPPYAASVNGDNGDSALTYVAANTVLSGGLYHATSTATIHIYFMITLTPVLVA